MTVCYTLLRIFYIYNIWSVHTKDEDTVLMRVHNIPEILDSIFQIRFYLFVPEVIAIIIIYMYLPGQIYLKVPDSHGLYLPVCSRVMVCNYLLVPGVMV